MNVSSREFEIDLKEKENDAFGKCLHGTKAVRDLLPNQINHSKTVQHKTAPYIQEPCADLHCTVHFQSVYYWETIITALKQYNV